MEANQITTFSFDRSLPLMSVLQMFIDLWAKDTDYVERNNAIYLLAELMNINKNPTEYVVTFSSFKKISDTNFQATTPSIKVNSNTRVSEIDTFFRDNETEMPFMEVKIIELQPNR